MKANAFESVVYEMAPVLSRPQCVKHDENDSPLHHSHAVTLQLQPGPTFTKRTDVLLQDSTKSRSGEIRV